MCTYHGWTYDLKGSLVGVPGFKEVYHEELDRENWGLIKAPKVESYRGFVFASLAQDGPTLKEFLGESRVAFDDMCDRAPEGEVEVVVTGTAGGQQRRPMRSGSARGAFVTREDLRATRVPIPPPQQRRSREAVLDRPSTSVFQQCRPDPALSKLRKNIETASAETRTRPPAGVNFTAFESRFTTT